MTIGIQGYTALPGYKAAKFGVRGLAKSVALDLGGPPGALCPRADF